MNLNRKLILQISQEGVEKLAARLRENSKLDEEATRLLEMLAGDGGELGELPPDGIPFPVEVKE